MDSNNTCPLCLTDTTFYDANTFWRGFDDALKLLSTLTDYQQPGCGSNDKASSSEVGHD